MSNMKYTVGGVQQERLLELNQQIHEKFETIILNTKDDKEKKKITARYNEHLFDLKDAYILTYLKDLFASRKMITKLVDNKIYKWIEFDKIMSYLPLLGLSSHRSISRRFQKYEEYNLLVRHNHKAYNKVIGEFSGSYTFIYLQDSFYKLFEADKVTDTDDQLAEKAKEMGLSFNSSDRTEMSADREDRNVHSLDRTEMSVVNTPIYSNNYTTTKNQKSSSSISQEISDLLKSEIDDPSTIENISEVINKNQISFDRVKSVITYCKQKNKGYGYIYKSLKMNWPIPEEKKVKNTKLDKTLEYIETQIKEKNSLTTTPITTLTPEEEAKALEILEKEGQNRNFLETMKRKSIGTYYKTLASVLKQAI
ncbi:MAG: hypothetical protein ACRC8F_09030 [Cetobacterium sp.]